MSEGWHELGGKQLRYVYQLFADGNDADTLKTLCLLQWGCARVVGRQINGSYLLKRAAFCLRSRRCRSPNCCRISHGSPKCRPRPFGLPKSTAAKPSPPANRLINQSRVLADGRGCRCRRNVQFYHLCWPRD